MIVRTLILFAVTMWSASFAVAKTTIVVDLGTSSTAQEAAHSEARVNWSDGDPADDTRCTQAFAAVELQHFLRKGTGRADDFEIVDDQAQTEGDLILIGDPDSNAQTRKWLDEMGVDAQSIADVGQQGYRIRSKQIDNRRITILAGGSRVGTLYAAYDLLHRLGFRWFAPGEIHEEIPQISGIPDLDVTEQPDFISRGFDAWQDRASPEFLLWMARNRLNGWCAEQSNHPLLRKLGFKLAWGGHPTLADYIGPNLPYPYAHRDFPAYQDKPADPYAISPEFKGDENGDGKLTYFEAHPEWYAFKGGKRIPGIRGERGTNFCTSNPDAVTEFMKNFMEAIISGPGADAEIVRFWTLDAGKWCDCESCKALGIPTDRNLLLVTRLTEEIRRARETGRTHRDIGVRFLAYYDVLEPATRALPDEFDNRTATATYYPIHRCFVHAFEDPACRVNVHFQKQLAGWATDPARHYTGPICVGEYYNVSRFRNLPIVFMNVMAADIPFYHRAGATEFVYMHVTTADWGNKALTNYQLARQLWDVKTDCSALWADYFQRRYGPATAPMEAFYRSLEQMLSNANVLKYDLAPRLNRADKNLFPDSHLQFEREPGVECVGPTLMEMVEHGKTCRRLLDEAKRMDLPPQIATRIAEDEARFTYGQRTIEYIAACASAFRLARQGDLDQARVHHREAARLAEILRNDTESMKYCYTPFPDNALQASLAPNAVKQLDKLLNPPTKK